MGVTVCATNVVYGYVLEIAAAPPKRATSRPSSDGNDERREGPGHRRALRRGQTDVHRAGVRRHVARARRSAYTSPGTGAGDRRGRRRGMALGKYTTTVGAHSILRRYEVLEKQVEAGAPSGEEMTDVRGSPFGTPYARSPPRSRGDTFSGVRRADAGSRRFRVSRPGLRTAAAEWSDSASGRPRAPRSCPGAPLASAAGNGSTTHRPTAPARTSSRRAARSLPRTASAPLVAQSRLRVYVLRPIERNPDGAAPYLLVQNPAQGPDTASRRDALRDLGQRHDARPSKRPGTKRCWHAATTTARKSSGQWPRKRERPTSVSAATRPPALHHL
jgi:hypothetical protein